MTKKLIILFVAIGFASIGKAQEFNRGVSYPMYTPASALTAQTPPAFAVRTNLLYWATLTPNFGIEFGLSNKMTLNLTGGYNPWNLEGSEENNKKLVHLIVEPELRYWFCERFNGSSVGIHGIYADYNVGQYDIPLLFEKAYRYEGTAYGGGISYNYHWMVAKHFGVEFNIGAGFAFMKYTKYNCGKCEDEVGKFTKSYLGPTKIGINLIYVIK